MVINAYQSDSEIKSRDQTMNEFFDDHLWLTTISLIVIFMFLVLGHKLGARIWIMVLQIFLLVCVTAHCLRGLVLIKTTSQSNEVYGFRWLLLPLGFAIVIIVSSLFGYFYLNIFIKSTINALKAKIDLNDALGTIMGSFSAHIITARLFLELLIVLQVFTALNVVDYVYRFGLSDVRFGENLVLVQLQIIFVVAMVLLRGNVRHLDNINTILKC